MGVATLDIHGTFVISISYNISCEIEIFDKKDRMSPSSISVSFQSSYDSDLGGMRDEGVKLFFSSLSCII